MRREWKQGSWTVKDGDAMVDDIQLGRVFTMFEKDEVRQPFRDEYKQWVTDIASLQTMMDIFPLLVCLTNS